MMYKVSMYAGTGFKIIIYLVLYDFRYKTQIISNLCLCVNRPCLLAPSPPTPELLPLPLSAPISIIFPQLLTLGLFCVEYKDSKIISKLCLLVKRPCLLAPSPPSPHIFMGPAGPKQNTRASSFTLASPPPNLYTCTPW